MAFTFGFYNSFEHDRLYDAIQVSSIFDGIILDGVYATIGEAMIVRTTETDNTISIGPGRAWFRHTWNLNDSRMLLQVPPSDPFARRIDAVVIDVNSSEKFRENSIMVVKGVSSQNPVPPVLIDTPHRKQYPLCYITRKPNVERINQEDIENRVGSSDCPFVTGVLEHIDIDLLLLQWKDQWAQFVLRYQQMAIDHMQTEKERLDKYLEELKLQVDEFHANITKDTNDKIAVINKAIKDQEDYYNSVKTKIAGLETEFTTWFNHIKEVFGTDPVGAMQVEIENLREQIVNLSSGLENSVTIIEDATDKITTTTANSVTVTTFSKSGDSDVITTVITPNAGDYKYTKTTTIEPTATGDKITTNITQQNK